MSVRLAVLSASLVLAAAPVSAQNLEYAAGTNRYRVSTTTKGSQSTPMGSNDFELGVRQQITLSLMKHAKDTMVATVTVDSIVVSGAGATADVSTLTGAKIVSRVSPTGRVYSTQAPPGGNPMLTQFAEALSRVLPVYRANLRAGATWSDTTSGKVTQQGMEVDRTIVSNYRVEADTTIGGVKAFKIARATSVKAAGTGNPQGTPVAMESTSSSSGAFFLSTAGVFLGSTSTDDLSLKLTILAQGAEINMKQSAQTKVEQIQ